MAFNGIVSQYRLMMACATCGKAFPTRPNRKESMTRKFCSRACSAESLRHPKQPASDRFWLNVTKTDGCWEWQAGKTTAGYGKFWLNGRTIGAHRVAYELAFGPISDDLFVCHHCDNPPCCNPAHLFVGTAVDNGLDMSKKGRGSFNGQRNPGAARRFVPDCTCLVCGTIFRPKAQQFHRGQGVYCSKKCMGLAQRATNNPNYRHGGYIREILTHNTS